MNRIITYQFIFCISLFTLLGSSSNAQEFIWAKAVTGPEYEYGVDADLDSHGNLFIIGHNTGPTLSIDGITYNGNGGGGDAFIAKLSPGRQVLWFRTLGGNDFTYSDNGFDIHVDANDNVIVLVTSAGNYFTYNGDTISGINSQGQFSGEGVMIKMDNNGNYLWHDDGSTSSSFQNVTTDSAGNVYLTGWFRGLLTLADTMQLTNTTNGTTSDMFVAKYSPAGALLWAKNVGGTVHNSAAFGHNIALDEPSGKVVVMGRFNKDIYFDSSALSTTASYATFLVSYDTSGTELWKMGLFNNGYSFCQGLDISPTGLIGVAGFNSLASQPDGLVGFYDLNGNIKSEATYPSTSYCRLNGLEFNHLDDCYITGVFFDTLSIGAPPYDMEIVNTSSNYNGVILKLSPCQTPVWAMQMPASFENKVSCKANRIFYSGRIDQPFIYNYGQDSITNNSGDAVFAEIIDTIVSFDESTDTQSVCNSYYTWIDGNTYTSSNYTATHTLTNAAGCDSVVTLHLTIYSLPDITTSLSGATITANNANASHYQWLDCDNAFSAMSTEAGQSFTATQNGSYAIEIGENGCIDTSDCVLITSLGVDEYGHEIKVTAYPNPFYNLLTFSLADNEQTTVLLYDFLGQQILQQSFTNSTTISTEQLADGIYFYELRNSKGTLKTGKVVKQR